MRKLHERFIKRDIDYGEGYYKQIYKPYTYKPKFKPKVKVAKVKKGRGGPIRLLKQVKVNKQLDWSPNGRHNWAVELRAKANEHLRLLGKQAFDI